MRGVLAMMIPISVPDGAPLAHATVRCRTVASGGLRQLNYVRGLPPIVVEDWFGSPENAMVASPSETLLAALGSCLSTRIHANAASASIVIRSLELDVEMESSASPMWDPPTLEPRRIGAEAIRVAVHIIADASPDALRALVAHALLWSPVANTLHDPVHLDVALGRTS